MTDTSKKGFSQIFKVIQNLQVPEDAGKGTNVGVVIRTMAFIGELSLTYGIAYTVLPHLGALHNSFLTCSDIVWPWIIDRIPFGHSYFIEEFYGQGGFEFFFIYLLQNIFFNFLLSVSFPLFMCGVETVGGFKKAHLVTLVRSLIGFAMLPFVIFDTKLLFGKMSLKEKVLNSPLVYTSFTMRIFGPLLVVPSLILFGVTSPVLTQFDHLTGLIISSEKKEVTKIRQGVLEARKRFSDPLSFSSSLFQIQGVWPQKIVTMPYFQGVNTKGIKVYNREKEYREFTWYVLSDVPFKWILSHLSYGNPLLRISHPFLYEYLTQRGNNLFDNDMAKYVFHLISASLELSSEDLINGIFKLGPFLAGPLVVKNKLLHYLNLPTGAALSGRHRQFLGKSVLDISSLNRRVILTKELPKPLVYIFETNDLRGRRFMGKVEKNILRQMRIRPLNGKVFFKKGLFNTFSVLDYIQYLEKLQHSKKDIEFGNEGLIYYYHQLKRVVQKRQELIPAFNSSIRQISRAILVRKLKPRLIFKKLRAKLNTLKFAEGHN